MIHSKLLTTASFTPNSLQPPNAWVGHLPFASWILQEVAPKIFVELGTHTGNSYFSFCQTVVEANLSTKCYAVDTWQGDEHAGQYGYEVFEKVNTHHHERYAGFSRLLRMTFDHAAAYFANESIELLHIDGLHTYEAVRADFETWLPKLAPGAVVMFHDTNVRERDFGVWKLWEELQAQYPSNLEFLHSNGLGVLQLSTEQDRKKLEWLQPHSPEKQALTNYFSALGSRQLERFELNEIKQHASSLNKAVAERDRQIDNFNQAVAERDRQIDNFNQAVAERNRQIDNFNQAVAERDRQIDNLNQAVAERDGQIAPLNQSIAERDGQIAELKSETVSLTEWALRLDGELREERTRLLEITHSNSWRITLPLRETRRWLTTPRQQTKRYLRGGMRLAKRIYQSLPLSYQTKAAHRNALAKYFPKFLLVSGSHSATISVLTLPRMQQAMPGQFANPVDFAEALKMPTSQSPLVSVVIPIYGQIDYTLRCLASIAANPQQAAFEIIVVDDYSLDNSIEILAGVKGIRLIRNEQNQGFIRSCNAGASVAQGEFLYFLNNDTEVTPGWMDELLRTFREFPGTGLAGSKLIYPDGRLQEAGGIIWQDGSAWNFGRFQDSLLPVYNYAREVDYCSGASIMVPKVLFNELGGFDEHYLPAYCEDSDLALKIRDKGHRVIYQPLSTVIHYEGITSGTDTSQGTKAYQIENSKKLYERWKSRLQTHQPAGMNADKAKDRRATRRVLVIDHCTPTPNQDSGSIDAYNIMLLLREMDFQVTFLPEDNLLYMPEYTTALQRAGIEVLYAPYTTSVDQHLKDCGDRYNLALLFRPGVAERHMKVIRKLCPKAKVLFHTVDLHFLRMTREAEVNADQSKKKDADEMKQRELALITAADIATVVSTQELTMLSQYVPGEKIRLLPYSRHIEGTKRGFAERRDVVFVGGYQHTPNVDAVHYFVTEIMPLLRTRLPAVRFYAVGSKPPAEIKALACEDVIITGFVEDLTPLLDKMRVSVAPLRYGAGIKGKIGSAMAVGLPVVATTLAAEGMSLTDGENILVAEGEQFAEAIVRLYQDEALWNRISHNGLVFAENAWGAEAAWKILSDITADLGMNSQRSKHKLSLYSNDAKSSSEIT